MTGGLGAATSAWVADECNRVPGQERSEEEEELHGDAARNTKVRGLSGWGHFKVPELCKERDIS